MSDHPEKTFGAFTLRILRDQCIGTAACAKVAPDVLTLDSQQIITFTENPPADTARDVLYEACDVCPVEALELLDADGERVGP